MKTTLISLAVIGVPSAVASKLDSNQVNAITEAGQGAIDIAHQAAPPQYSWVVVPLCALLSVALQAWHNYKLRQISKGK